MRILANENILQSAVEALRARGHDVVWVLRDAPKSGDDVILARAQREGRIVLTFDKDFGMLAFQAGLPAHCGVILARLQGSPVFQTQRLLDVIASRDDWTGQFVVIENSTLRVRPLPPRVGS